MATFLFASFLIYELSTKSDEELPDESSEPVILIELNKNAWKR
jgi:hypothetical protein